MLLDGYMATHYASIIDRNLRLMITVLRMKMRWRMFIPIELYLDPLDASDNWHCQIRYQSNQGVCSLSSARRSENNGFDSDKKVKNQR